MVATKLKIFLNLKYTIMAVEFTEANFEEMALKSDKPVLIDFWAEWCGPCRMVGPVVEEIAKEYDGKAVIGKVNVDENPGISMKYGIRNIPTILFLKNGEVVDKSVGAVPKSVLTEKLDSQILNLKKRLKGAFFGLATFVFLTSTLCH
jgi:thioredoxin 1